jgi:tripartite-type tricarboxylate transporter receptor subunit TctC
MSHTGRRRIAASATLSKLSLACALAASLGVILDCAANGAAAEDRYPSKPIKMIVSFAAGGPTDTAARIMSAKMGELLGQSIFVENRTGAGGSLGADAAAKSDPDGYTLLMATVSTHAINPGLYKKLAYDPINDFTPIGQVGVTPTALAVHPSVPAKDVQSLIALIKANPGKYSYGSSGMGSILHLCGEQFRNIVGGLTITHVPYRGSAPMISDLVSGQIQMVFDATPTVLPQVEAGNIRALGAGMATRMRAMPQLPTLQEQGVPGFECYTWNIIYAPAKTPSAAVARLAEAMKKALADPMVVKRLLDVGIDPTPDTTPEKAAAFAKAELAKWAKIIKAAGVQLN